MSDGLLAASLLPSILSLFGIQDYKGLDTSLKNQLSQFAQNLIDEWQTKQQMSAYSSDHQVSNLPNRNQLQTLMYQTFANETRKLAQAIQDAQDKDIKNWDKNRGWYMLDDTVETVFNTVGAIPDKLLTGAFNVFDKVTDNEFKYSDMYKNLKSKNAKRKYKQRNYNLLKAKEKAANAVKSQKETFDKFNNYVIQSRDRFGNNNNNNNKISDNNRRNENITERTNRETKF